jgi:serine/threonine-protein kinase RsbW
MTQQFSEESSIRSIEFKANFESLSPLRDFVGEAARDCGLNPKAVYAVQMAVDEGFTNIIEHAYGGECREEIRCTCEINQDKLTIVLQDCGQPFNPEAVPAPDLEASLQERKAGGLGLFFMRQLMDEVSFTFAVDDDKEGGCNVLTMVKRKEGNS